MMPSRQLAISGSHHTVTQKYISEEERYIIVIAFEVTYVTVDTRETTIKIQTLKDKIKS